MISLTTRAGDQLGNEENNLGGQDFQEDEDFEFEEVTAETVHSTYLDRINKDFDTRKNIEEIILRIINFYQRCPQKHPQDCEEFQRKY